MSLTTLALLKEFGRIGHDAQNTLLQLLLDAAEEQVAKHCGCYLIAEGYEESLADHEEYLDGGGENLYPTYLPITGFTSAINRYSETAYGSTVYHDDCRIWRYDGTRWDDGTGLWLVTYEGGYTIDTMPKTLKQIACQIALRAYANQTGAVGDSEQAVSWGDLLSSDQRRILQPFRLIAAIG